MEISLENLHVYKVLPYVPVRIPSKSQKKKKSLCPVWSGIGYGFEGTTGVNECMNVFIVLIPNK